MSKSSICAVAVLLVAVIVLAGCGGGVSVPTLTPPVNTGGDSSGGGRSGLPTIEPVTWRNAGAEIAQSNGAGIELLGTLVEHSATVNRIEFTPDSQQMLTVDGVGTAYLWDLQSGQSRFLIGIQNTLFAFFSADAAQIVSIATDEKMYFTSAADGSLLSSVQANSGGVIAAAQTSDRRLLATGGTRGDVQLWDLTTRSSLRRLSIENTPRIAGLAWSPDGTMLAVATSDLALHFYSTADGAKLHSIREYGTAVRKLLYAADGSFLVAANPDNIFIYDTATFARRYQLVATDLATDLGLALSPDGTLLAAGTSGDNVVVWSTETGKEVVGLLEQKNAGSSLMFSPNGEFLLDTILRADAGTFIWAVESFLDSDPQVRGKNFNLQGSGVFVGAWTPDGRRIVLADGSGGLYIYGLPG